MTIHKISTKTIARIAAIQTFYQYQSNSDSDLALVTQNIINFYLDSEFAEDMSVDIETSPKIKLNVNYLQELTQTTLQNLSAIDQLIIDYLVDGKDITELQNLLLALLRIGVCELKYFPNVPCKVVINEYTDIAGSMLAEQQIGFVNFVLDNIAKDDR